MAAEPNLPNLPRGAVYLPDFIDRQEEAALLQHLDDGAWSTELKRRVQHFGYHYDYKARNVAAGSYLGALPAWLLALADKMTVAGSFTERPDQVIANEYQPGQGISAHIDCQPCFGPVIASLSLFWTTARWFSGSQPRVPGQALSSRRARFWSFLGTASMGGPMKSPPASQTGSMASAN